MRKRCYEHGHSNDRELYGSSFIRERDQSFLAETLNEMDFEREFETTLRRERARMEASKLANSASSSKRSRTPPSKLSDDAIHLRFEIVRTLFRFGTHFKCVAL